MAKLCRSAFFGHGLIPASLCAIAKETAVVLRGRRRLCHDHHRSSHERRFGVIVTRRRAPVFECAALTSMNPLSIADLVPREARDLGVAKASEGPDGHGGNDL